MEEKSPITNRPIPQQALSLVTKQLDSGESVLFAVVGDLGLDGKYAQTVLFVSEKRFFVTDASPDGGIRAYVHTDVEKIEVKRMYGNARLSVTFKSGEKCKAFRSTYAVASLCDAAALFIEHMSTGTADLAEELDIVDATYEKMMSVVPNADARFCVPAQTAYSVSQRKISQESCLNTSSPKPAVFCFPFCFPL